MRTTGNLNEWARSLDAHSDDEAAAVLTAHVRRLDEVYDDLTATLTALWAAPSGDVPEVLMVARTAVTEAVSMLESVRARFNSGERVTA